MVIPRPSAALRVGLFGHLGKNNIGNDASMEAILRYLRIEYPEAVLDAMCTGPEKSERSIRHRRNCYVLALGDQQRAPSIAVFAFKLLGKGVDAVSGTALWVRRHDVVIVPGMGVLEASLPLRPWDIPYALFLLCVSGRLFNTKVALVSVGAGVVNKRLTRWLQNSAARLADYRAYSPYRIAYAMPQRACSPAYRFSRPRVLAPRASAASPETRVRRHRGDGLFGRHRRPWSGLMSSIRLMLQQMKRFVLRLIDSGSPGPAVSWGTPNGSADGVVQEILATCPRITT